MEKNVTYKKILSISMCCYLFHGSLSHAADTPREEHRPSFTELSTVQEKEQYIKNVDLSTLDVTSQQNILQWLDTKDRKNIQLMNCTSLDDNYFVGRQFLSTLVILNLQGSSELTSDFLLILAQNSPQLAFVDLSKTPKIKHVAQSKLVFWYEPIKFEHLQALNVDNCPALEYIDIEAPMLKRLSVNQSSKLKVLRVKSLRAEYISCQATAITDNNLYEFLYDVPHVKTFNCAHCFNLTQKGKDFHQAFFNAPTLTSLDLSSAGINDAQSLSVGPILKKNTTITALDLSENNIGPHILKDLLHNKTITKLKLAHNKSPFTINGMLDFIENKTINDLDLSGCDLSQQELLILARSKIKKMNLSEVVNVDNEDVLKALASNTALLELNVIGCIQRIILLSPRYAEEHLSDNLALLRKSTSLTEIWAYLPGHGHARSSSYTSSRRYFWHRAQGEWVLNVQ